MVTVIPGSDLLTSALNVVSQSLQIPVIIFLLLFALYAVITVGGLISEYTSRKKVPVRVIKDLIFSISRTKEISEIEDVIKPAQIPKNQKRVLVNIARSGELKKDSREALETSDNRYHYQNWTYPWVDGYLNPYGSGACCIRQWRCNNLIQCDYSGF